MSFDAPQDDVGQVSQPVRVVERVAPSSSLRTDWKACATGLRVSRLVLIRHSPVHSRYAGLCYGRSDVELSEAGWRQGCELAVQMKRMLAHAGSEDSRPIRVVSSDLQRTRLVAEEIGYQLGVPVESTPLLRERDFGAWELRPWEAIYQETGDAMLGMLTAPATYRPGGGETTWELRDRVTSWLQNETSNHDVIVVTHGGPIAALRGTLGGLPVTDWPRLIPVCGESVVIERQQECQTWG